jgi:4-amino-4-deoxy-L-arabinose transferase-like glycosyltransferase
MMELLFKKNWQILLIVLVAALLRLYQLNSLPASLSWDEAAIGWNAKSIFATRRDEYGTRLPLVFKSFGDYKAPLYIYLTAPIVGVLGLQPWTIRLLSALSGISSIYFIYLIVKKLFEEKTARVTALVMAISPWSMLLSRGAFEASLSLCLILLGIYGWLKGERKIIWQYLSVFSLALSMYAYHSAKLFVPLLAIGLVGFSARKILARLQWKSLLILILLAGGLMLPLIRSTVSEGAANRVQGTSIFYNSEEKFVGLDSRLMKKMTRNWFAHYDFNWLFLGGEENFRQQLRDYGLLLLVTAPFLAFGLIQLIKQRERPESRLLIYWLIIGPIAAVIGREVPHAIRAYNLLPALAITTALGIISAGKYWKQTLPAIYLLLGLNFTLVFYHYLNVYPNYSARDWQYGMKQAIQIAREYENQDSKVLMSSYYGQPYIFTLVYQDRQPETVFWGAMSQYLFRAVKWEEDKQLLSNYLIIGSPEEIPADAKGLVETIYYPDGSVIWRIVKTEVKL